MREAELIDVSCENLGLRRKRRYAVLLTPCLIVSEVCAVRPQGNVNVMMKLQSSLESAGIQFTGDPLVNPGVTLDLSKWEAARGQQ